jgi:hypothetical protein
MNIRIQNLPPGVSVEERNDFLGDSDDIEHIELNDEGNADNVVAIIKVTTGHTGANAMAEFIDVKFFRATRLSAQALALINQ